MIPIKTLAISLVMSAIPFAASADLFNFSFSGYVDRTNAADNSDVASIGDLNVDDAVSGSFVLDSDAITGGLGTFGAFGNAISDFNITVDGYLYAATGLGSAYLYDNHMPGSAASVTDAFFALSGGVSGASQGGLAATGAQFSIGSILDLTILSSLAAPTLLEFQNLIAANSFDGNTNILGFGTGEDVRYSLTDISVTTAAVPLPAAGLMLLAGLGGLGAMRRRKT